MPSKMRGLRPHPRDDQLRPRGQESGVCWARTKQRCRGGRGRREGEGGERPRRSGRVNSSSFFYFVGYLYFSADNLNSDAPHHGLKSKKRRTKRKDEAVVTKGRPWQMRRTSPAKVKSQETTLITYLIYVRIR